MGQLEKYGLYVLCLVIFLILGVTIWGGGDLPQASRRLAQNQGSELNANPRSSAGSVPGANAPVSGAAAAPAAFVRTNDTPSAPDLSSLLQPVQRPPVRPTNQPKPPEGQAVDAVTRGTPDTNAAVPGTGGPSPASTARPTYKVKQGDTFDSIAKERLGNAALRTEIARLNPRVEPSRVQVGQELQLPTAEEIATLAKGAPVAEAPSATSATYTVVQGDTFESIARKKLGSVKRLADLREANPGIEPKSLRVGEKIRLPKK